VKNKTHPENNLNNPEETLQNANQAKQHEIFGAALDPGA
jgi:hypothetical protein